MFLAIDTGNTQTIYAIHDGTAWREPHRVATDPAESPGHLAGHIQAALDQQSVTADVIEQVGVSSVVPALDGPLVAALQRSLHQKALFIAVKNCGVKIEYPIPSEIGADRLADAAGALAKYKPPLIIVDFGTATTFDYINEAGAYCGGPIAPGVLLAQRALTEAAAKLPPIDFAPTKQMIPQSTEQAMQAGIFHSTVGAVDHVIKMIQKETGDQAKLLATGGLATTIVPALQHELIIEPMLTLDGIKQICKELA